jgi:hypothetical protein
MCQQAAQAGVRSTSSSTSSSAAVQVRRPVFNGFFGTWGQATNLKAHSKSTKQSLKYYWRPPLGARAPNTEFLRLFASESTTNTPPRTHCNTLLAPHRSVVLPVSSLAAFGKSPAARGSRNGPRTPPTRRSAAGTALGRDWGALPWGGGCLAGCCWCGGCLASRWGLGGGSVGPVKGSERRVFASEVSQQQNGTWTQLGGTWWALPWGGGT